jgi:hypothetical protein
MLIRWGEISILLFYRDTSLSLSSTFSLFSLSPLSLKLLGLGLGLGLGEQMNERMNERTNEQMNK